MLTARRWCPLLVLFVSAAARADGPACPPLPTAPLPPVAAKPASARSLAESRRAVQAIAKEHEARSGRFVDGAQCNPAQLEWEDEKEIALLDELVRREPADFSARAALFDAVGEVIFRSLDTSAGENEDACRTPTCKALRAQLIAEYERLRDQAWGAGCKACAAWIAGFDAYHAGGKLSTAPEVDRFLASIEQGPPGEPGDGTRAIVAYLEEEWNPDQKDVDRALAARATKYLDPATVIVIDDEFYSSGADVPTLSHLKGMRVRGAKGLRKWMDKLENGLPGTGYVTACDTRCCRWKFEDHSPHHYQIIEMCFDARHHLNLIRTELGGM
jgi:hypothetical protein